jgi:hypothetical protein
VPFSGTAWQLRDPVSPTGRSPQSGCQTQHYLQISPVTAKLSANAATLFATEYCPAGGAVSER